MRFRSYELAVEQGVEELLFSEMVGLKTAIRQEKQLKSLLKSPAISVVEKKSIIKNLFLDSISPLLMRFLIYLLENRREQFLERIILEYESTFNASRNIIPVKVFSAIPLTNKQISNFQQIIQTQLKKEPQIENIIDASLIGGYRVTIGFKEIDQSVKGMLQNFKKTI